jgi:hypothetical protein
MAQELLQRGQHPQQQQQQQVAHASRSEGQPGRGVPSGPVQAPLGTPGLSRPLHTPLLPWTAGLAVAAAARRQHSSRRLSPQHHTLMSVVVAAAVLRLRPGPEWVRSAAQLVAVDWAAWPARELVGITWALGSLHQVRHWLVAHGVGGRVRPMQGSPPPATLA